MRKTFLTLLLSSIWLSGMTREVVNLNFGWQFSRDSLFTEYSIVDVPHDFQTDQPWVSPAADERADQSDAAANTKSRLSARGFKEMGIGWYRKTIDGRGLKAEGKRLLLDFEGIMLVGDVYLNGQHIGGTDYGYVGFEIDITGKLRDGDNVLMVKANTMGEKNSRWYTGGGLFRNVTLVTTSKDLYFNRHPLRITTRDNRLVNITAEICYHTKTKETFIDTKLYAPDGRLIHQQTDTARRKTPARTFEVPIREITVGNALLWDTEHPYLYRVVTTLRRSDGSVADEVSEEFGIRTIEIAPEYGLKLNGKKVLLKGYANHHTLGALGAAAYPRAIEKRIRLMKQFGINHIRTSHNPYSRQFIRLCDQYGILVVDELYDKWTQQQAGGRVPFMHHWAQDIEEWVRRDRNSPSVVLWSLGNELQQMADQPFNDFGVTCYKMMRPVVERYDATRKVTVAMHPRYRNWETDSLPCDLARQTDVQSYNYRYMYFPGDGRRFPWMTFYQSEASVSNMGPNYFEMNLDKVIGLAYWGAIDYLGESQGWPAKGWAQGVFDISLQPKPKAYLMKSLFSEEPTVHLAIVEDRQSDVMWNGVQTGNQRLSENWNRTAGTTVNLYTYTNCEEVELRLNGHSLGRKTNPQDPQQRNQLRWDNIPYQTGKLEAIGYNGHTKVASHQLETTGKAVRLIAEADNDHWKADGEDLQHVRITAVDTRGRQVWEANDEVSVAVEGPARLVAISNGDITSDEWAGSTTHRLWNGTALLILRAGQSEGTVRLTVKSPYKPTTLTFNLEK
ncbi:MAG: DUF4982 domain-containing protein [Prevotella sp.]|nr:DUF4982 domain-containing protein [Prevotella sp.]